ncbi:uncharacterized protein LOC116920961 [Daphnia magna]|uniref:uncharacterized protein LOC116920961 n=1 Tax=Daphnia magna TaxID=35525 RepID=UPI001E1BB942|nr:uncharacterized protein LOC116920961 [Daphnia magna]XP_045028864.1 uncharacterized protein LOC116920961 [Daphnia magna]XP_045028865.1 uncharacterized protein LOC116920961 [Daphnia magna]
MGYLGDIERLLVRRFSQQRSVKLVMVGLAVIGLCVYVLHTVDVHHRPRGKPFRDGYGGPFKSVCSRHADRRGAHQQIIAYSIFGNFSAPGFANQYLRFLRETLNSVPLAYPGWVVRIYHNLTMDDNDGWKVLENTIDFGDHIDLCNATELIKKLKLADIFAMTWRWLPLLDDMVDSLMSRDTDSAIISREQDAVREWLASNRTFHIMRDNPKHRRFMLGCCWGVKISQNRFKIADAAQKMFHQDHRHVYDYDQKLLDRLLRPLATTSMMAHDSYSCEKFPDTRPYPTQRKDGLFVGGRKFQGVQLNIPCPLKCRPANATSEWTYC